LSRCQISRECHRESRDAADLDIPHPPGLQDTGGISEALSANGVKTQSGDKYLYNPSKGMESHSASLSESNTAIDKKEAEFRSSLQSNRESDLEVDYKSHCDEGFGEWGEWSVCERIGRDKCKSVRTREYQEDGSERYQLDVNPCDCQDAGELEEDLDEFPDDVIRAEWKEHTDSNEAQSEEDSVEYEAKSGSQEEDSVQYDEFKQEKESEEDTDTTTFQEEDVSNIFEDDENDGTVTRERYHESSDEFYESNDDLSGAEQSDEDEFADESEEISFSKSRNRRKKHSRIRKIQTRNGIKISQETSHEESSDSGKVSQEDESFKSLEDEEEFKESKDVTKDESNESFESSEEKSTLKFEDDVTRMTDEPVFSTTLAEGDEEQTTGPSFSNEDEEDTTKIKSSEEEEETTDHVKTVTEIAEMPSDEVDDLFKDRSRESQSSEDTPSSSVQQSAPDSKDSTNIGSFEDPFTFDRKRQRQGGLPVALDRKFDREWKPQGQGLGNNLPYEARGRVNSLSAW